MKTKVLLLGAALAMTTAIASAQTYSSNVVGYVNVDLVPGWNLIANPLDAGLLMLVTVQILYKHFYLVFLQEQPFIRW